MEHRRDCVHPPLRIPAILRRAPTRTPFFPSLSQRAHCTRHQTPRPSSRSLLVTASSEIAGDNDNQMFKKIKAGQYKFLSPYWDPISADAKAIAPRAISAQSRRLPPGAPSAQSRLTSRHANLGVDLGVDLGMRISA